MNPEERRRSGSYYTPAGLVRDIVRTGLESVLVGRLGLTPTAAERWIYAGEPPSHAPDVGRLTVLDPAVGSGAFLLGALDELAALRGSLCPAPRPVLRRAILATSLYGVDLKPTAVRLTELRLWLALVADDEESDLAQLTPLPNLDGQVRSGDALLDPLTAAVALGGGVAIAGSAREVRRLAQARREVYDLTGVAKRRALNELARAEAGLAADLLSRAQASLEARIRTTVAAARERDLFGRPRGLDADGRRLLKNLREGRRSLRAAARRIAREGEAPFFSFESHFGDVMSRGGFDLVLGNPPWVRGERLPARVREALTIRYPSWRASGRRGFAHTPDLAVAFVDRALELVAAPGGTAALLVPAKLASSGYAEPLRRRLASTTRVERAAALDVGASAFAAAVYPMALVVTRADPAPEAQTATALGPRSRAAGIPQRQLEAAGPWILTPHATKVAGRLRAAFPTLGERWIPRLGLKTGADDVFLTAEPGPWTRPAIRGRDIGAWTAEARIHVVWAYNGEGRPLAALPSELEPWLAAHVVQLRRRADYRAGPPWQLFRVGLAVARHRVIWPDLARRLQAAVPSPAQVPLNTTYGIATRTLEDALALSSLLNSRWLTALACLRADPARGGFRRFNAGVVRGLPIPPAEAPGWKRLIEAGRRRHVDEDAIADLLELDASDRRVLSRVAPDPL